MGDTGRLTRGLAAAVMALALTGPAVAQDGLRMIDGSLTYLERMALPPDALAVVEARDGRGRLLGEATLRTRGAQVPIGFRIAVPEDMDAELRAALVVDGRPEWYISGLEISAGTDPVSLGDIQLSRFVPMGFASRFRCGASELSVGYFGSNAVLERDGRRTVLLPVPSASGMRFEAEGDPGTWVLSRGNTLFVSVAGARLPECSVVPPETPKPWRAQGKAPGWTLTIADGRLTLVADKGALVVEAALPEARFEDGGFVYDVAGAALVLRQEPDVCRDDRTGLPYPETVTVTLDGARLSGCGGDPRELLTGAEWIVEDIAGREIVDTSRITMNFDADGRIGGIASCNRYAANLTIGGEGVNIGQIAATRTMCPEALMTQEQGFFAALAAVGRFDIDDTGALLLYDPVSADPALTARR